MNPTFWNNTYVDIDLQELLMKYPDLCLSPPSGTKGYVCIHLQDLHVKETHVPLETYGCVNLEDLHVKKLVRLSSRFGERVVCLHMFQELHVNKRA